MKKKKKLIIALIMTLIIISISIIPIFADNIEELSIVPNDISNNEYINGTEVQNIKKLYIKVKLNNIDAVQDQIYMSMNIGNNITINTMVGYTSGRSRFGYYTTNTSWLMTVFYILIPRYTNATVYIPLYIYNNKINSITGSTEVEIEGIYYSILDDPNQIANELYRQGYSTGYAEGLQHDIEEYTNITGYVEQLLTQFVGSDNARYITPIAIVLVVLFVYFLFIRFLLSMIKAKGVIKTCDITMLVACIILLVVMYAPMLNLTIKTENVGTEQTEQTESVQLEQRNIYIYDENGNIIGDVYNGITKITRSEVTLDVPDDISTTSLSTDTEVESLEISLEERTSENEKKE